MKSLREQHYYLVGKHSAVKICTWTKKSLVDEDFCYKQKFYGVQSHRCCQMTPCLYCCNRCIYCWRDTSQFLSTIPKQEDEPEFIFEKCIEGQRVLLSGFGSNPKLNWEKFREAQYPRFWAISLAGEPLLYGRLSEFLSLLRMKGHTSFLVTNGQFPERLEALNTLPTQLYLSLDAPSKEIYEKVDRPLLKDFWERLMRTIEIFSSLKTRKVIRLTLVKDYNMCDAEGYAKLIEKANPDFVEVKAYMWVGYSRKFLKIENMPSHTEIKKFAKEIEKLTSYSYADEKENSRVVLLTKGTKNLKLD